MEPSGTGQHAAAELLAEAAGLSRQSAEALAAGDLAASDALEVRADRLRRRARQAMTRAGRPPRAATGRLSAREQAVTALAEMGVPSPTREIAAFHAARFGTPLDVRALASVRRDESDAWEREAARTAFLAPALDIRFFRPVRGPLTLSSWELPERLLGPGSARVDHLRLTCRLAELAGRGAGVRDGEALAEMAARYAETLPGATSPGEPPDADRIVTAARRELEVIGPPDAAERAEAAQRGIKQLSARELVWGRDAEGRGLHVAGGSSMSSARSVAALAGFVELARCPTASAAFAQAVDLDRLLAGTGYDVPFGQSQFAFSRGQTFERRVKGDRGDGVCSYGPMLELLRDELGYDVTDVRTANLRALYPPPPVHRLVIDKRHLINRERETRRLLDEIAHGVPGAVNFIDGAVVSAAVGGQTAFYETDGLAFRLDDRVRVIEIKSFPKVDGRVDPAALASALDQGALYILLVRRLLEQLGLDGTLVSTELVLICPRNVAMTPCLSVRDVRARMRRVALLLDAVPAADPAQPVAFDRAAKATGRTAAERVEALYEICDSTGTEYGDACEGCAMVRLCRERAHAAGDVRCLGERRARVLTGVPNLPRAVALAGGAAPAPTEASAALTLQAARRLRDQALTRQAATA